MENYVYVEGVTGGATQGSGKFADVGGAVLGALTSSVVGGLFAKDEAKKARKLQEQLGK